MNRHERRRAAALAGGRTGYLHRVMAALGNGNAKLTPGVYLTTIEHDRTCAIYRGGDCNCVPNVSVSDPHGGVTVVDERGNATKMRKQ
jgi:hypothetical protein